MVLWLSFPTDRQSMSEHIAYGFDHRLVSHALYFGRTHESLIPTGIPDGCPPSAVTCSTSSEYDIVRD